MKKYLASLVPFVFCTILSFIYAAKTPKDYPDPSYPYQTKGTLTYLSTGWFYIGVIISAAFICMFLLSDIVDYVAKAIEKKRMGNNSKRG